MTGASSDNLNGVSTSDHSTSGENRITYARRTRAAARRRGPVRRIRADHSIERQTSPPPRSGAAVWVVGEDAPAVAATGIQGRLNRRGVTPRRSEPGRVETSACGHWCEQAVGSVRDALTRIETAASNCFRRYTPNGVEGASPVSVPLCAADLVRVLRTRSGACLLPCHRHPQAFLGRDVVVSVLGVVARGRSAPSGSFR